MQSLKQSKSTILYYIKILGIAENNKLNIGDLLVDRALLWENPHCY